MIASQATTGRAGTIYSFLLALVLLVLFVVGLGGFFLFFKTEFSDWQVAQLVSERGQKVVGQVVDLKERRAKYGLDLYPVVEVMNPDGKPLRFTDSYQRIDSVWPAKEVLPRLKGATHPVVCVFSLDYCHVVSSFENRDRMPQYRLFFLSFIFIVAPLTFSALLHKRGILFSSKRNDSSKS